MANIHFTPLRIGTSNSAGERISSVDPLLSRTNYFDGQLLKAADLNRDQIYLDDAVDLILSHTYGPLRMGAPLNPANPRTFPSWPF